MSTVLKGFTHLVIIRSQNMSLTEHIKDVNKTTFRNRLYVLQR